MYKNIESAAIAANTTDAHIVALAYKALEYIEPDATMDDIERYFDDDSFTVSKGRDGNLYLWYFDVDAKESCINVLTGEMIPPEKTLELF